MNRAARNSEFQVSLRHVLGMYTHAACPDSFGGIDFDERYASFFRFARELGKECRPRGICNAFGKTMVVGHPGHLQVFDTDDPKLIDDLAAFLMGEVLSPPRNPFMHTGDHLTGLAPLRCPFGMFGVPALYLHKSFLF